MSDIILNDEIIVPPYHPKSLKDYMAEVVQSGYAKDYHEDIEEVRFAPAFIDALGKCLSDDVKKYIDQIDRSSDLPEITIAQMMPDSDFQKKHNEILCDILRKTSATVGLALLAKEASLSESFKENTAFKHDPNIHLQQAFNMTVGSGFIMTLTRLSEVLHMKDDLYQEAEKLLLGALSYGVFADLLKDAAKVKSTEEEFFIFNQKDYSMTWQNLARQVLPVLGPRYIGFKL